MEKSSLYGGSEKILIRTRKTRTVRQRIVRIGNANDADPIWPFEMITIG